LKKLIAFKSVVCPEDPNQLNFRSGAQRSDYILTLSTIPQNYTKITKVFACFVN
jgi:hypothetical protein